jgi:hypothetical protein
MLYFGVWLISIIIVFRGHYDKFKFIFIPKIIKVLTHICNITPFWVNSYRWCELIFAYDVRFDFILFLVQVMLPYNIYGRLFFPHYINLSPLLKLNIDGWIYFWTKFNLFIYTTIFRSIICFNYCMFWNCDIWILQFCPF